MATPMPPPPQLSTQNKKMQAKISSSSISMMRMLTFSVLCGLACTVCLSLAQSMNKKEPTGKQSLYNLSRLCGRPKKHTFPHPAIYPQWPFPPHGTVAWYIARTNSQNDARTIKNASSLFLLPSSFSHPCAGSLLVTGPVEIALFPRKIREKNWDRRTPVSISLLC